MSSSSSFTQKQSEWDHQAGTDDVKNQVCRPFTDKEWDDMVADIRAKLLPDNHSGPTDSILDVGCGNALVLSRLAANFTHIYGVDYGYAMIEKARENLSRGTFKQGEAGSLNFADNRFDRVLCYSIFHYFPDQKYVYQAIEQMIRVCKPGGVILIGDLLDSTAEQAFKAAADIEYEKALPLIFRYSQWLFVDFDKIKQHFEQKFASQGLKVEVLSQPEHFKLRHYRKDLRIWC
ncbi:MAG: ubiquinone/menaquinone biosynthesis C-methylase UbiE [Phenylobacterium sp.]|jgi:ubiquinone/menaquinone biosynthesis C-methylase UbiE